MNPCVEVDTGVDLKGHGKEADFLGFLQKLVPHRSLTLPFEPFRFWLRIRLDICNQKTTPRLGESASRQVDDSPTRRVGESLFKFFKIYFHFKGLNQPFKRSIWQKRSQGCNVLSPLIYLKVWKKLYLKAILSTPRLGESGSGFSITNISGAASANVMYVWMNVLLYVLKQ